MLCRCPNRAMLGRIGGSSIPRRSGEGGEHAATSNLPSFYFPATRNRPCRRRSEASFIGDRAWVEGRECEVAASEEKWGRPRASLPGFMAPPRHACKRQRCVRAWGIQYKATLFALQFVKNMKFVARCIFFKRARSGPKYKSLRHGCIL